MQQNPIIAEAWKIRCEKITEIWKQKRELRKEISEPVAGSGIMTPTGYKKFAREGLRAAELDQAIWSAELELIEAVEKVHGDVRISYTGLVLSLSNGETYTMEKGRDDESAKSAG